MQESFRLEAYKKGQKHYRLLSIVQDCSSSTFHVHFPHSKQDFLHFLLTPSSDVLAVLGHQHLVQRRQLFLVSEIYELCFIGEHNACSL